ncbi:aKG-HExxH-type peptide beta-hydroxylase [Bordetella hinzii]|uniref:aKG-HExxH-type peptide beta-hydroxylase n=1 Tax=Bordetella hinzii TaxID=103855 RepID=UPI0039FBA9D8
MENLKKGTTALHALSPYHHALFELLISDIVLLPSTQANGGSTSDALGVIWANPSPSWRPLDTLEFLVHELTHQCMFIDEICNQHYDYSKIVNKDYWTTSAILNRPRPADKVLHSIVVSTEILLLRERILGHPASPRCHPPTTLMRLQVGRAIDELLAISSRTEAKGLLAPRAVSLLRNCQMLTAAIDVSPLEH